MRFATTKPGAARQPVTSFCFAKKKVTKKKATAKPLPCGFPKAGASQGEGRKLASLKQCGLLIPCLTPTFGSCFNAGYVKSHVNININININFNFNFNYNFKP
ncbi:MAG: hypothetical protein ACI8WM_003434 [Burkholderiaceae bacterium]